MVTEEEGQDTSKTLSSLEDIVIIDVWVRAGYEATTVMFNLDPNHPNTNVQREKLRILFLYKCMFQIFKVNAFNKKNIYPEMRQNYKEFKPTRLNGLTF